MTSETELHLRKVDALTELARSRLRPPDRERVVGILEAAAAEARRGAQRGSAASDAIIRNAEEKLAQAEADRDNKRRPYEADPLFMYLWRRRFGTRDYAARSFVRSLDRKVAHLIGFEAARVNYAMLLELPDRMREHVERLREQRAGVVPDEPRLVRTLAAVEQQPEIVALLREARSHPGPDEAVLREIDDLERTRGEKQGALPGAG